MGKKQLLEVQFLLITISLLWNNHERNIVWDVGFSKKSKGLLHGPEAEGTTNLQNIWNYLPVFMV